MTSMKKRLLYLLTGIILSALGMYMMIQANIGLSPWDAFSVGISHALHISVGSAITLANIIIITTALLLKEKLGLGTVATSLLIGPCIDFYYFINLIPTCHSYVLGIPLLLLGQLTLCLASYFYISPGFGCGPRDALTVAMGKRASRISIGIVRVVLDAAALLIGWLLGSKIGVGTLISALGYGFIMQLTFQMLHFDVKAVYHQNIIFTWQEIKILLQRKQTDIQSTPPADE